MAAPSPRGVRAPCQWFIRRGDTFKPRLTPERRPMQRRFRIGTRGSKLALIQAHMVAGLVGKALGLPAEEAAEGVVSKTTGEMAIGRTSWGERGCKYV